MSASARARSTLFRSYRLLPHIFYMTPREIEEYRALRATILQRGTARFWILIAGLSAWAALVVATAALVALPVATLLFLLAVFEAIFAIHTAVERIGRYIQVFHEPDGRGWEHAAMSYGRVFKSGGMDALFTPLFWAASVLNLVPMVITAAVPIEWAVVGAAHLLFAGRVWSARRQAGRQRADDLDRFSRLKANGPN